MASQTIMLLLTEEQSSVVVQALKKLTENLNEDSTLTVAEQEVADELRLEILKKRREKRNG